ncbi:MAG: CsgE family curli-type amyloid fiber assembly protein [Thermodesulfovibrio sp.]|uniref:CsgE family curli-type amyloid fiber assembly protein n=1 Tax=unclassified Thermodesulfovibrio TaxID=2645936 RepID=UPI00083B4581|nr:MULTISPECIES: CsgE family curli-type amyloid fiber assembly protein [unclassified Thermodesulfovibrio]MDI1472782.1 CsgE family curli-type amyloid fiber assembly protein [Thermodesulfovibrio sp. 1176]MDI6713481.1 CsgE family curli-type amyloid fiber assembly protein [Thermodesulfovibrio sp.]
MKSLFKINFIIFLLLIFSLNTAESQIEGFVIDKTKTKIGRDFYELFYINLSTIVSVENRLNITIEEFFDPQFGSRVSVLIDENIIYQNFVSSRFDDIEEKVKEATEIIQYFFMNWKEYEKYLEEEGKIR